MNQVRIFLFGGITDFICVWGGGMCGGRGYCLGVCMCACNHVVYIWWGVRVVCLCVCDMWYVYTCGCVRVTFTV